MPLGTEVGPNPSDIVSLFTLIRPTVWAQCTNVTDRIDGQTGQDRTTLRYHRANRFTNGRPKMFVSIGFSLQSLELTSDSFRRLSPSLYISDSAQRASVTSTFPADSPLSACTRPQLPHFSPRFKTRRFHRSVPTQTFLLLEVCLTDYRTGAGCSMKVIVL